MLCSSWRDATAAPNDPVNRCGVFAKRPTDGGERFAGPKPPPHLVVLRQRKPRSSYLCHHITSDECQQSSTVALIG